MSAVPKGLQRLKPLGQAQSGQSWPSTQDFVALVSATDIARQLNTIYRQRMALMGLDSSQAPAWELLIALKGHEGPATIASMARIAGMHLNIAHRWIITLINEDLVERTYLGIELAFTLSPKAEAALAGLFS